MVMSSTSAHGNLTGSPGRDWDRIEAQPEYRELRAMQRGFTIPATACYLIAYFGFLLLAALAPGFLGTSILGSINLGFVLIVGLFVLVWALVRSYIKVARERWDPQAERIASQASDDSAEAAR